MNMILVLVLTITYYTYLLYKYYCKYSADKERYDSEMKAYASKMKFGSASTLTSSETKRPKPSNWTDISIHKYIHVWCIQCVLV